MLELFGAEEEEGDVIRVAEGVDVGDLEGLEVGDWGDEGHWPWVSFGGEFDGESCQTRLLRHRLPYCREHFGV